MLLIHALVFLYPSSHSFSCRLLFSFPVDTPTLIDDPSFSEVVLVKWNDFIDIVSVLSLLEQNDYKRAMNTMEWIEFENEKRYGDVYSVWTVVVCLR